MYEATRTQPLSVDKLYCSTPWVFVWQLQKVTQTINQWLVECMTWIPIQITYGHGHLRVMQYKTTCINDSALILSLGCLWAIKVQDLLRSGFIYLFLFSVVSSFSGWRCFSCCCGRDLPLFFSAAVAWVLSILLKIIKQHAIETEILLNNLKYFLDEFGRKSQLISDSAIDVYVTGRLILNFLCLLTLCIHQLGLGHNRNWEST